MPLRSRNLANSAGSLAYGHGHHVSEFHSVRASENERDRAIRQLHGATGAHVNFNVTTRSSGGDGGSGQQQSPGQSYFVPSLQAICADLLARNFAVMPEVDDQLRAEALDTPTVGEGCESLYDAVVQRLPPAALPAEMAAELESRRRQAWRTAAAITTPTTTAEEEEAFLPLSVAVTQITNEAYWKRCCTARWSAGQLSKFTAGTANTTAATTAAATATVSTMMTSAAASASPSRRGDSAGQGPLSERQYGWKRLFLECLLADHLMALRCARSPEAAAAAPAASPFFSSAAATGESAFSGSGSSTAHERLLTGNPAGRTTGSAVPAFLTSTAGGFAAGAGDDDVGGGYGLSRLADDDDALRALTDLCAMCRDYVHTVDLPCQYTHLEWEEHLFSRLPGILNFRLTYGTASAGIGYDKAMLGFTDEDAESIRHLLGRSHALESLRLPQNFMTGAQARMVCAALVGNTRLRVLDLSCNALGDDSIVEGVALLLCQPAFPLEELNLGDNDITAAGAAALADALSVNLALTFLSLRQNRIGDGDAAAPAAARARRAAGGCGDGCAADGVTAIASGGGAAALLRGIGANPQSPLRELNLRSNGLGAGTVAALRAVLPGLTTLSALNLSGNRRIGGRDRSSSPTALTVAPSSSDSPDGVNGGGTKNTGKDSSSGGSGELLCEAIQANTSLRFIDVRFCGLPAAQVARIESAVQARVERARGEERGAREDEQRSRIAALVASRPTGRC